MANFFVFSIHSNPPIVSHASATTTITQSNQTSHQLPPLTTSTGKLDLANVMKLCGIMDDEDFMDTDETQPPQSSTPYDMPTSLNTTQPSDIMVTIPYVQNSDMSHNRVSKESQSINIIKNLREKRKKETKTGQRTHIHALQYMILNVCRLFHSQYHR